MRRNLIWFLAGAIAPVVIVCIAGFIFVKTSSGFSARAQPSALETFIAQTARALALTSGAREKRNPVANSNEVLADARAHWADHCAICHANNGSAQTEM